MKRFESLFESMRRLSVAAGVVFATVAPIMPSALAQGTGDAPSSRQVIVGGILFLTVRDAWGGLTPEQRAAQVQERINKALGEGPIHPRDITVAKVDGDWIVQLKGQRLYTADYDTAKLDDTAPYALASKWAAFLKQTLPGLTAPTNGGPH